MWDYYKEVGPGHGRDLPELDQGDDAAYWLHGSAAFSSCAVFTRQVSPFDPARVRAWRWVLKLEHPLLGPDAVGDLTRWLSPSFVHTDDEEHTWAGARLQESPPGVCHLSAWSLTPQSWRGEVHGGGLRRKSLVTRPGCKVTPAVVYGRRRGSPMGTRHRFIFAARQVLLASDSDAYFLVRHLTRED